MNLEEFWAIEARAKAATPAPWITGSIPWQVWYDGGHGKICRIESTAEDRDFIAHAREDIPALIESVNKLRSELGYVASERDTANLQVEYFKTRYENACLGCDAMREEMRQQNLQLSEVSRQRTRAVEMLAGFQAERDAALLQIGDAMGIIQDHCDLLSEQPADSKRPFIIGARARLAAFIERYKIKTGPEQYTEKRNDEIISGIKADGTGTTQDRCRRCYQNPGIEMKCAGSGGCYCACHIQS